MSQSFGVYGSLRVCCTDRVVGVQGWLAEEDDPSDDPGSPMPFKA